MIRLRDDAVGVIQEHAIEAFPEECCGFLLGYVGEPKNVIEARRGKNIETENRASRYIVDTNEMMQVDDAARTKSMEMISIYQSYDNYTSVPSALEASS